MSGKGPTYFCGPLGHTFTELKEEKMDNTDKRREAMRQYLAKVVCGKGCHLGMNIDPNHLSPCTGCGLGRSLADPPTSMWIERLESADELLRVFPSLTTMDPELL